MIAYIVVLLEAWFEEWKSSIVPFLDKSFTDVANYDSEIGVDGS